MMASHCQPRVSENGRTTQLSYEVSHRINCARAYPRKASNGSTIIVYGHSSGIRIAWLGGRSLQRVSRDVKQSRSQDLHLHRDEGSPTNARTLGYLDIPLACEVVHVSVPSTASLSRPSAFSAEIFRTNIVVAVACADSTAKVLVLPLELPIETGSAYTPRIASVNSVSSSHRSYNAKVAITWTGQQHQDPAPGHSESGNEHGDLLLASAATDASGTILLTRIPVLDVDGSYTIHAGHYQPFTKLQSSPRLLDLAFNPAPYPSARHTELLVVEEEGLVRLYDALNGLLGQFQRSDESSALLSNVAGSWKRVFSTPYQTTSAADSSFAALARRKPILSAQWVCEGKTILALTADGDYGFWDVNGHRGRSVNAFSLAGSLGSSTSSTQPDQERTGSRKGPSSRSSFAPMTPNTRAAKAEQLFSAVPRPQNASAFRQGWLSIKARGPNNEEESVVVCYGGELHSIPNLQSFLRRHEARGDANVTNNRAFSRYEGLNLQGQSVSSIDQLPLQHAGSSHSPLDLVVAADHRLILLLKQVEERGLFMAAPPAGGEGNGQDVSMEEADRTDMELLDRSELGLPGIDRMADSMSGSKFGRTTGRKVLFAPS